MQHVVSATTGTTAMGRPRKLGTSSCSTEAKKEFKSRNNQRSRGSPSPASGLWTGVATHIDSASGETKAANGGKAIVYSFTGNMAKCHAKKGFPIRWSAHYSHLRVSSERLCPFGGTLSSSKQGYSVSDRKPK